MVRSVLSSPEQFIRGSTEKRGYKREIAVVVVCGLLGAPGMAWAGVQAMAAIPREAAMLRFQFIGQVLFPVVVVLILWLWYTVAGHLLARYVQGRGPISRLLRPAAWSMVPIGLWFLLRSIVIVVLFRDVDFPADPEGAQAAEELAFILGLGLESPLYVATILAGIAFTAWSGYLLAEAVEAAKGVDTTDARKIAVVPSGVFAVYLLWRAVYWVGAL
jgi:hypothetical protein